MQICVNNRPAVYDSNILGTKGDVTSSISFFLTARLVGIILLVSILRFESFLTEI